MQKADIKDELEKALRRPISQTTFAKFDREGYIQDCLDGILEHEGGEKENFQALKGIFAKELDYLNTYRREMALTTIEPPPGEDESTSMIEREPSPSDYVSARASAISEFLAMRADSRPDVAKYREKALGGRLLSSEETEAIVNASEDRQVELQRLGNRLANDYLGWDEEGAIRYILTGEAPRLRAIKIRGRGKFRGEHRPFQHEVTFSVLPWVSAKEVERVYRNIQRQLLEETSRETGTRILQVACFYWEHLRSQGSLPSWPDWAEHWNETHPDKKFPTWRHFREYVARGVKAALPRYKFPEPKLSAEKLQAMREAEERFSSFLKEAAKNHRTFEEV